MSTLICFALKEEAAPLQKFMAGKPELSIILTGIGKQNAENALGKFFDANSPELVLTCGFAGGLNPDLKVGDVIFEVSLTPSLSPSDGKRVFVRTGEGLVEKLLVAGAKPAKIFCADRVATTVADKKKLRDDTGADVGEMESGAIQAVCRKRGILCATVRVISDTADEDLPLDFNALAKPDKNIDFGKLALAVAKSPGKIPALMKLQKQTQFAAEQLAKVLIKILQQLR